MSRYFVSNSTCHTADNGAAFCACASFVMMILAGIAAAVSVLFILPVLLCLCGVISLIIILRLMRSVTDRPEVMKAS